MATYKMSMRMIGGAHIADGLLLPFLWAYGFFFPDTYYSVVGAPVWCSILFFIPAGILGIIAGNTGNRGVNVSDVAVDIVIILLALFELSVCILGTVYSARTIQNSTTMQASTVVYGVGGVANPGMQNPGAQVQIQYPAQPVQGQYPGAPDQGQYPGPPAQGQYPPPQEQKY